MSAESKTEKVVPTRVSIGSVEKSTEGLLCDGGVLSGSIQLSDDLIVAESGQPVSVLGIQSGRLPDKSGGVLERASAGASVVLTLPQGVPVSPGALLVSPDDRPEVADQFAAFLDWIGSEPMLPGRKYRLQLGSRSVVATVTEIKYRLEPGSGDQLAAKTLNSGETAFCNFSLSEPIAFDRHEHVPETATFSLSPLKQKDLLGTGRVAFGLRRATNVHWQAIDVDKGERAKLKRHKPAILWFTGLSGSGKSTVANLVERALHSRGYHTYVLDGDNVRHGLNRDLGFSDADRVENIRRVAEVSKLFVDAGMLVVVAFISPFRAERKLARDLVEDGEFFEVFVDTPIDECRKRDPKGLYARADRGEIKNFTGVDSPYEVPEAPEIHLRTMGTSPPELAERVLAVLAQRGVIPEV